ncbi:hypothetical protein BAE44_0000844 [Dichanthelium oligosanthes]|uniref:Uncharacterized protein n=1 Tax=Dichanthelium oligosanthes TaxID=888268 RepID=A0A1E5WL59_9POAL|nr:hypothetical protein BAE44_0000844 [Dichanthelium oligosanthes]
MSILPLLLVLHLGIGGHTDASKLSMPILRQHIPPPEHNIPPEEPPASTDIHITCRGNKFSWPELVGKKGKEAKAVIQRENPYIDNVVYAPQDAIVTDKYFCNRVRLLMNCDAGCDYENARVFQVPVVG